MKFHVCLLSERPSAGLDSGTAEVAAQVLRGERLRNRRLRRTSLLRQLENRESAEHASRNLCTKENSRGETQKKATGYGDHILWLMNTGSPHTRAARLGSLSFTCAGCRV